MVSWRSGNESLKLWTNIVILLLIWRQQNKYRPAISSSWHFVACRASRVVLVVVNPPDKERDTRYMSLIPGSGRSPGGGNGNPLQYSCLGKPMKYSSLGKRSVAGTMTESMGLQRVRCNWVCVHLRTFRAFQIPEHTMLFALWLLAVDKNDHQELQFGAVEHTKPFAPFLVPNLMSAPDLGYIRSVWW